MKKGNLLSKSEMRKFLGGLAVPVGGDECKDLCDNHAECGPKGECRTSGQCRKDGVLVAQKACIGVY